MAVAAPSPTSGSTSPTGGGTYWRVFVACACVKILFWPSYHSTDFEVHRNWLAVTASTPMAYWYADQPKQSPWTLDSPPLFGVFERFLSFFAKLADPMIVEPQNLDYAAWSCVAFQRFTVVVAELACLGGGVAVASGGAPEFAVLFAGPGLASLFVVDHVHFQYNGVFLGVLACCAGFLVKGQHVRAAVAFTLLMCMKHLFLTLAPFFGVYLLFAHVLAAKTTLGEKVLRLVDLGAAVTATAAASLAPLVVPAFHDRGGLAGVGAALGELKGRLFPFGDRGLVHSYWAPNAWALYAFLDRVAMKASGREGGGATRGVVETQIEYLPAPGPLHCALLTLLAAAPALLAAARTASTQSGARGIALPALAHACLAAFAFGWHVHEKFLIVALVPLAFLALGKGPAGSSEGSRMLDAKLYRHFARLATFAMLPLLPSPGPELATKVLVLALEECCLRALLDRPPGCPCCGDSPATLLETLLEGAHLAALSSLFLLKEVVYPLLLPADLAARLEFLPLMLTSVYCAAWVSALSLLSAARLLYVAYRADASAW